MDALGDEAPPVRVGDEEAQAVGIGERKRVRYSVDCMTLSAREYIHKERQCHQRFWGKNLQSSAASSTCIFVEGATLFVLGNV